MKVVPIKPQTVEDRHVQFSEFVDVRIFNPSETTAVVPTMDARRLEHQMRTAPTVQRPPASTKQPETPPQAPSKAIKMYKSFCEKAALLCGAFVLPSFVCLILGPIGLVAPAGLAVLALAFTLMRGSVTEEIRTEQNRRAEDARRYDCT